MHLNAQVSHPFDPQFTILHCGSFTIALHANTAHHQMLRAIHSLTLYNTKSCTKMRLLNTTNTLCVRT